MNTRLRHVLGPTPKISSGTLFQLHRLTDLGNTVLVIEHNLEVIKTADWLIDLGPEGGEAGGRLVASGTPEEVARVKGSYTGRYLKEMLPKRGRGKAGRKRRASG